MLLGERIWEYQADFAGSVYISLADTHSWVQGLYVLSAVYVDRDVAALFSFQYTTGLEILRA